MPTIFLNGSAPNYAGFEFTNAIQLLNKIEETLVSAGWTSLENISGVSLFVKGTTANNHNCWVEFVVSGTAPFLDLRMRGWLEQDKINGSPDSIHFASFITSGTNRLWLTADNGSGCFCIYPPSGTCSGHHFGFLNRVDQGDPWAWMIGNLNSLGYAQAYVSKSGFDNTVWKQLSTDYFNSGNYATNTQILPLTTFDFLSRGKPGDNSTGNFAANGLGYNAFVDAQRGRLNYNGSASIDPYGYIEGRGNTGNYLSQGIALYFRGNVKFAYCGVASLAAASQVTDPVSGNRILSVGSTTWQGMRIL